ncbi:hypothetical protein ACRAWD_21420 [Caulobacter segnis]
MKGRPALSLTGHSHTLENMAPGDSMGGWNRAVGSLVIPFRHLVAGARGGRLVGRRLRHRRHPDEHPGRRLAAAMSISR